MPAGGCVFRNQTTWLISPKSVPFITLVAIALGMALISQHVPGMLFGLFMLYGLSGYGMYVYRRVKGKPVSVIATSTDEPDEEGLHR